VPAEGFDTDVAHVGRDHTCQFQCVRE
jgi:hypothetical protein